MIRYVWIACLLTIVCVVLYVPSVVPAEKWVEVLKAEHAVNLELWGQDAADRVLRRMLDLQQVTQPLSVPPSPMVQIGQKPSVNLAVAEQVTQMSWRLFRNPYFRSIDALLALATYRLSTMLELAPMLLIFMVVASVDGWTVRAVRAREFVGNSAETFGVCATLGIALGSLVVVQAFVPFSMHPMHTLACLLAMLWLLSRALANYHAIR